jgi:V8-like Glu-specific endopeptidase
VSLDAFPYPWAELWAQHLHRTLTQLYPTRQALTAVAERAGIDMTTVNVEQAVSHIWIGVLDQAALAGLTRTVVCVARDLLPAGSPRRQPLDDLLSGRSVRTEGEPRDPDGAPRFIHDTDTVGEPEALLYKDDLTISIGAVPGLITTLRVLLLRATAVCKLTVAVPEGLQEGTAFRIGGELLLTNWHVLHGERTGTPATTVTAEFGYEDGAGGEARQSTVVRCDVAFIVGDSADDWAVIRVAQPLADTWSIIPLSGAALPAVYSAAYIVHSAAYIVQHPDGRRKRLGFVRNQVSHVDERVVQYLTDTEWGSSGSPVFSADGALIAVHHAGGRPQEVLGRPPITKNEGIRIPRITAGLRAAGIPFD